MRSVVALTLVVLSFCPVPGAALEPLDAEALHTTLRDLIDTHPTAKRTHVALKVTDLETGEVLFDQNSNKLFTPASNLKIYTSAAALDLLGPGHRWRTRLLHNGGRLVDGTLTGFIELEGGGDPMLDTALLGKLADELLATPGLERIDAGFSVRVPLGWENPLKGPGWMWDDDPDYYNMSVQSLMLNFNTVKFVVKPGPTVGEPLSILSIPHAFDGVYAAKRSPYTVAGGETTAAGKINVEVDRQPFTSEFVLQKDPSVLLDPANIVLGQKSLPFMPINATPKEFNLTVHDPAHWIEGVFIQMLIDRGAEFVNGPRRVKPHGEWGEIGDVVFALASVEGKTNAEAVKHFLKVSENAVGEMLLLTLSEKFGEGEKVSWPSGAKIISDWLVNTAGLEDGSFRLVDGSGLSRYNLISADSSIRLLAYMKNESEHFEPFFDGLPIYQVALPEGGKWGGVPVAEFDAERVFAKPGGMSGVSTISGYVQTLDGRWLAFSLLGNGYIGSSAPVRDLRNQVWAELVRYQPAAAAVPAQ